MKPRIVKYPLFAGDPRPWRVIIPGHKPSLYSSFPTWLKAVHHVGIFLSKESPVLHTPFVSPAWHEDAKCAFMDPARFEDFAERGPSFVPPSLRDREAARLCEGCPVVRACAKDALKRGCAGTVRAGVWMPAYSAKFNTSQQRAALTLAAA